MKYRGYAARIEYSDDDGLFIGHIAGIRDVVGFHGESVSELREAFEEAVDDYLATCEKLGREPQRPFSVHAPGFVTTVLGTTFNIRAFPEETTRAVSLLTGSIDVARTDGVEKSAPLRLTPHQQLRFDAGQRDYEVRTIEVAHQ